VTLDAGGVCADARVVLRAVVPTAILVLEVVGALVGRKLDETTLAGLDQTARRACKPIDNKRGTIEYVACKGAPSSETIDFLFTRRG